MIDHGSPLRHESVRYVRVHVRDEDDHVPQFGEHVQRFSVRENAPAGTVVGRWEGRGGRRRAPLSVGGRGGEDNKTVLYL